MMLLLGFGKVKEIEDIEAKSANRRGASILPYSLRVAGGYDGYLHPTILDCSTER